MGKKIDLTGQRFGRLTVVEKNSTMKRKGYSAQVWDCECDCGKHTLVTTSNLRGLNVQSCGCFKTDKIKIIGSLTTHGQTETDLYAVWKNMKQRCLNPKSQRYHNYGGRGITYCDEWELFEPFYEWSKNSGYRKGLSIDRINNNGNYEPSNCKWSTPKEQANNRRTNIKNKGDK